MRRLQCSMLASTPDGDASTRAGRNQNYDYYDSYESSADVVPRHFAVQYSLPRWEQ